jgi:hypothetical protein
MTVVDMKIGLNDPADLTTPSVGELSTNGNHDARRLARFEDNYD